MLMFRFWGSDIRGSQKSVRVCQPMTNCIKPQHPVLPLAPLPAAPAPLSLPSSTGLLASTKRRRSSSGPSDSPSSVIKRQRSTQDGDSIARPMAPAPVGSSTDLAVVTATPDSSPAQTPTPAPAAGPVRQAKSHKSTTADMNRVREVINNEMGHEILLKHNELRLIEQELAKCQVALEQLRRCHLIPYPVNCPTPDQVLDMVDGKGPALQPQPGTPVPQWAAPFGVVDGPYARHYAKWLIPDPKFDGIQVDFHLETKPRNAEGRTTRNSYSEGLVPGKRPARGISRAQTHQSLSSGYPVKNDKAGPCTLIRQQDGIRVKLVCVDCHRENFSSTQGFINHCRIAHKRDYKSHEEAARKCGQALTSDPQTNTPVEERPVPAALPQPPPSVTALSTPTVSTVPGQVHPFARPQLTEQEAYVSLQARIADCVELFQAGQHAYSKKIPTTATSGNTDSSASPSGFVPSSQTPYLSKLLGDWNISKNLQQAVDDAKKPVDGDEMMSEDSEDGGDLATLTVPRASSGAMRVPSCKPLSPAPALPASALSDRPESSKGRSHHVFAGTHLHSSPQVTALPQGPLDTPMPDIDSHDGDLSPNTLSSNNAPSLVSDDGEYEESDMPSDSEAGDSIAGNSVSEVADIALEEDSEGRPLRHNRSSSGTGPDTVRLRRDDVKHVTFVSPIKGSPRPVKNATGTPRGRNA